MTTAKPRRRKIQKTISELMVGDEFYPHGTHAYPARVTAKAELPKRGFVRVSFRYEEDFSVNATMRGRQVVLMFRPTEMVTVRITPKGK